MARPHRSLEAPGSPSAEEGPKGQNVPFEVRADSELRAAAEDARVVALLEEARRVTQQIIAPVNDEDWFRVHHPRLGPVAWDVVHMGQQEDLWLVQILGGRSEYRPGENRDYDPLANPRPVRQGLGLLSKQETGRYRDEVRRRTLEVLRSARRDPSDPHWRDLFLHKMIVQHEAMHDETIMQHVMAFPEGRYEPGRWRTRADPDGPDAGREPEERVRALVFHEGGVFPMGARWRSPWTFDNEWPQHAVHVDPFFLDRHPVTNGMYQEFVEAGGYEDERWWKPEGWNWVQEEEIEAPLYWERRGGVWCRKGIEGWGPLDAREPVVHVSWYEADACARFFGCRLPTEAEWEYAALWDPEAGRKRVWPWGDREPEHRHANLDLVSWGVEPVGSHEEGASVRGVEGLVGDVWEWTVSRFAPYPGFEPFPYEGYSKAHFPDDHRVLRGGSWATRSSLRLGTFRNWDFPVRRQIFSGLRLAASKPPRGVPVVGPVDGDGRSR